MWHCFDCCCLCERNVNSIVEFALNTCWAIAESETWGSRLSIASPGFASENALNDPQMKAFTSLWPHNRTGISNAMNRKASTSHRIKLSVDNVDDGTGAVAPASMKMKRLRESSRLCVRADVCLCWRRVECGCCVDGYGCVCVCDGEKIAREHLQTGKFAPLE